MSRLPPPPAVGRSALGFLDTELDLLRNLDRLREPRLVPPDAVVLCSNDYLGYGAEPLVSPPGARSGAGASPLVVGFDAAHAEAERSVAEWLGTEAALLFSSGYAANLGTIGALVGRGDVVVSDALNHASIIDGCRLSGALVVVTPHLDVDAMAVSLQKYRDCRRRLVVTESYFSMDADSPDLGRLRGLCWEHDAMLMVDEAHALGVYGKEGRGRCNEAGVAPDVLVGTLGKSLGLHGAFVAGSEALRLFLWNRARSLVFSTGTSPVVAGAVPARVARLRQDEEGRQVLWGAVAALRGELDRAGWRTSGEGPIVPLVVGRESRALELSWRLLEAGLIVQAIRPPTVPVGTSRLRITVSSKTPRMAVAHLIAGLGSPEAG